MDNVFSFLKDSTQQYPQKVYVVDKEVEFTYSEVYKKVKALATYIDGCRADRNEIDCGDRILIYLDNSVEYITAFFATLLMNAIVVPINKNTTVDNLKFIIQDTSPRVIISCTAYLKKIQDKVDFGTCQLIDVDQIPEPEDYNSGSISLINKLTTTATAELPAMILYTSGTTRMPKGVTLTHKNLIANTDSILEYLELTEEDSILATINFSYSYGNSIFLTHTKVGGTIMLENKISYPVKVIEAMYQSKATGFSTVGSYINLLLKQESLKPSHLQYLRYITFAGESTSMQDIMKLNHLAPHINLDP
jgi:long-chain acyl-CoA synthetase